VCVHCTCRDDAASRRLTLRWVANNSMTVDLCANVAYSEQWLVFGVQGGSECWAGALSYGVRWCCVDVVSRLGLVPTQPEVTQSRRCS
jgi:hypothetical protein